jgi:hypothetical protein
MSKGTAKSIEKDKSRQIAPVPAAFAKHRSQKKPATGSETEGSEDEQVVAGPSGSRKKAPLVKDDSATDDSDDGRGASPDPDSDDSDAPRNAGLARFAATRPATLVADVAEMEFSQTSSSLFKQLYFFLDTSENAEKLALEPRDQAQSVASNSWASVREEIELAGGHIVGSLEDPKLTHVIVLAHDTSRASALFKL